MLLILEQSIISVTEKAQVGVNDEHTRKSTYHTWSKEIHFPKLAVWEEVLLVFLCKFAQLWVLQSG